jgi:hypothetical protein
LCTEVGAQPDALSGRPQVARLDRHDGRPDHHTPDVHARQPLPSALLRLASFQEGVVTTSQAESAGLTRHVIARCLADGQLSTIARGVYGVGTAAPSFGGLAWAGCLVGGEGSRVGGLAAAHLLRLADEEPDVVTVLLPDGRRAGRADPRWEFVRGRPGVRPGSGRGSPPRLSVEDTVLDLCDRSEREDVVGWVSAAVQRRLTTPKRLRRRVDERSRLQHRQLVLSLIDDAELGAESPIEIAYLNDVERAHGLLPGERQRRPVGSTYVTDVTYRPYALVVELDGKLAHLGKGRFRDMRRDNAHVLLGHATLRFGHADVLTSPCEVAVQVADVLIRCGWRCFPAPCRRCGRPRRP